MLPYRNPRPGSQHYFFTPSPRIDWRRATQASRHWLLVLLAWLGGLGTAGASSATCNAVNVTTDPPAQTLQVTNAGATEVNGRYTFCPYQGDWRYCKGTSSMNFWEAGSGQPPSQVFWVIGTGATTQYHAAASCASTATPDTCTTWAAFGAGTAPMPTIISCGRWTDETARCYLGHHADLMPVFCTDSANIATCDLAQARCHYVTYGRAEGREYRCPACISPPPSPSLPPQAPPPAASSCIANADCSAGQTCQCSAAGGSRRHLEAKHGEPRPKGSAYEAWKHRMHTMKPKAKESYRRRFDVLKRRLFGVSPSSCLCASTSG